MRIGVVADTHLPSLHRQLDDLGPEAAAFFATVELILHAGDVTSPAILDWLEQFAPVLVARGNNDDFSDPRMRPIQFLDIAGRRLGMVHNLAPERRPVAELRRRALGGHADILIGGHTHLERLEAREGALILNPGSPVLPHHKSARLGSVGLLELEPATVCAAIVILGHSEGASNPCVAQRLLLDGAAEEGAV